MLKINNNKFNKGSKLAKSMEYKIEKWQYKRKESEKIEFENSQKMFDYITSTFGSHVHDSIALSPFSNEGDYLVFFDEVNVIKHRERWEKHSIEVELIVNDAEGNRINIDSLSDLLGLEGVDASEIIVRKFNHNIR